MLDCDWLSARLFATKSSLLITDQIREFCYCYFLVGKQDLTLLRSYYAVYKSRLTMSTWVQLNPTWILLEYHLSVRNEMPVKRKVAKLTNRISIALSTTKRGRIARSVFYEKKKKRKRKKELEIE